MSHSTFSCLFSPLASRRRYETEQDCGSASQLTLADQELSNEECEICLIPFDKEDHVNIIPRDCVSKLFGALAGEVPLLQGIEPLVWRAFPPNHPDPLITFTGIMGIGLNLQSDEIVTLCELTYDAKQIPRRAYRQGKRKSGLLPCDR